MEFMEHTIFYVMYDRIRKQEARDLRLALKSHEGEFTWISNNVEQLY